RFEHIVVDGCSKDDTLDVLRQYRHVRWISEPDHGEGEALNKALRMARGAVIGWLNADDYYLPGVFPTVARELDPARGRHVLCGKTRLMLDSDAEIRTADPTRPVTVSSLLRWSEPHHLWQPSLFYSRALVEEIGPFREDLRFSIDYEYWLRICARGHAFVPVDQIFSVYRARQHAAKSSGTAHLQAMSWYEVSLPYLRHVRPAERIRFRWNYARFRIRNYLVREAPIPVPLLRMLFRMVETLFPRPAGNRSWT
ncbi:MAG: glycosyltransferase, partial [Planctomycetes bacterium]|nr:glycosyltransferase [Planctomycetota bacterium]